MSTLFSVLVTFVIILIIFCVTYLFLSRNKLNKLQPTAQRCYHLNTFPQITNFIPKLLLFSIIKPQGNTLNYCQIIPPHKLETKKKEAPKPKRKVVTINAFDPNNKTHNVEPIEIYEYFSQIEVMIDSISIDPLHLVEYNKLFKNKDFEDISMCYMNAMSFPLIPFIITKDAFPVSPLGLHRIGTEITIHQRLSIKHKYEITTSLSELRATQKGIEIDISTTVYLIDNVSNMTKMVYLSVDTWLSKDRMKMKQYRKNMDKVERERNEWKKEFDVNNKKNKDNVIVKKVIDIADDITMKYANITGDFSVQYLTKWSAMMIGYGNNCVHEMCALERCLTEIVENNRNNKKMFIYKYPIKVLCSFKVPIYIPNKSKLMTNYYTKSNDYLTFAMVSEDETLPHVLGSLIVE